MTSPDQDLKELEEKRKSGKNLMMSLFSAGLLILASVAFFLSIDSGYSGNGRILYLILTVSFNLLTAATAVTAVLALKKSLTVLKASSHSSHYIASGISILVLLLIAYEILQRF